jgi:hypothetical protein
MFVLKRTVKEYILHTCIFLSTGRFQIKISCCIGFQLFSWGVVIKYLTIIGYYKEYSVDHLQLCVLPDELGDRDLFRGFNRDQKQTGNTKN